MPCQTAAHANFSSGSQAQQARTQEPLVHCNLTLVLKGACWLISDWVAIPKPPSARLQAPEMAHIPALLAHVVHNRDLAEMLRLVLLTAASEMEPSCKRYDTELIYEFWHVHISSSGSPRRRDHPQSQSVY